MKAVRYHSTGGSEVLAYEDAPDPVPGPGEVVLRVAACAVNRIDVWARSGRYKTSLPHILGTDFAGEVVGAGPGVEGVDPGTRAVCYPVVSDGTCLYCRRGKPNLCLARGFVGIAMDGGYAELVKIPAANLLPIGPLDLKVAAAMPVDFGTSWSGLVSKANVGPDDVVLVWGAAGGLGHAAVQIAKMLGAEVIAAVGDAAKSEFVKSLGADHIVNYGSADIVQAVKSLTGGIGASVVFEHVGGETWGRSIECLARGGRMVTLGLTSGPKSEVDVRRVYSDELAIMGTYGQSKTDVARILELAAEGKLVPSIHTELPLSAARDAHEIVESRKVRGKVLLLPP
ncbi:MAG: zinc-binding dehydrogenase [Nitrososphaerota archaeon]|nr:zinc-binding dehydrogenase [Nitrososphaerota archaeon]